MATDSSNPDPQHQEHQVPEVSENPPVPPTDEDNAVENATAQAVRFASEVEEIAPATMSSNPPGNPREGHDTISEVTPEQLKKLSQSLQGTHLQERRMNIYGYEPFSLPVSRINSHEDESADSSRLPTPISVGRASPRFGSGTPMQSPPLTPAGTDPADHGLLQEQNREGGRKSSANDPNTITPQASSSHDSSPPSSARKELPPRADSSGQIPHRSTSADEPDHGARSHRKGLFSIGGGGSVPVSRESSPSRASQYYSKPMTPGGDANDPYAAHKRQTPSAPATRHTIDPRFVFSRRKKHSSPTGSSASLTPKPDKRHSGLLGALRNNEELQGNDDTASLHSKQGSMADLKRFFKMGGHNKMKREASPASNRSGVRTPPSAKSQHQIPFGDDHGLSSKYGKLGKVLGSGAGGSVRLMKRSEDNTVFAVKEFRPRHSYETEKEYVKKLTAEFCIGSTLHHGNVIETLDIVQERTKWFEVMEYAPYDLFAIVMTGKMSREEVTCCFLQILNGVTYLHSMGLAHRDLKLDNVVVSEFGIMKIIDFGSAHVFKYPFETDVVLASGIVGSDPYLAPEVYDEKKYDPQAVDIWSLAIIFCCMTLRRFPWKVPRMTDNSFKLFAAEPTPGHDPKKLIVPSRSTNDLVNTPARDFLPVDEEKGKGKVHRHHSHAHSHHGDESSPATSTTAPGEAAVPEKKEVIRGPWRILRLLPRESRHIIGRMLEINPKERAKMSEILDEPWVANTVICQQTEAGIVTKADDHTHILVPPSSQEK